MIEDSIRCHALTNADLNDFIDDRLYLTTDHSSTDDYILLRVINDTTDIELHLEDGQSTAIIQFDCYSQSASQAKKIAKEMTKTFNKKGFIEKDIKVQFGMQQHRIPDFEPDTGLYRESLNYIFNYNFITNED